MKTMIMTAVSLVLLLAAAGLWSLGAYNGLVEKDEAVSAAWGHVQNTYQRRADLVPSLVETVKGAAKFERETLREVVQARAAATGITMDAAALSNPAQFEKFNAAQSSLGGALGRLLVSMEKYPDLKATEAFRDLQRELSETEERILVERHNFNEYAAIYNAALRKMPAALIAMKTGMKARPYFKSDESAQRSPKVQF